MLATREDLSNVLHMVLLDNRGNVLTEALCLGIERAVQHYIGNIEAQISSAVATPLESNHG